MFSEFRLRKVIIPLLSLVLIFSPIPGLAKPTQAAALPAAEKVKKSFPNRPVKGSKVEIPEWRSAHAKHFLKDDGTFEMEITKDSVFYQDPDSKVWKDIDNTLVPSDKKGFGYKNKVNRFEVQFPKTTGPDSVIQFALENSSLEFHPLGMTPGGSVSKGNQISYKNAYKNTDVQYTVQSDRLKEDILLQSADAPTTFSYELKLNNLTYESKPDGSIDFKFADTSRYAFSIPKPYMYEAGDLPQISDKVTQTIRKVGNQVYLDITADAGWIQAPGRKLPVTIDPTTGVNYFKDTFASSTYPTSDLSSDTHVYAGTTSTYGKSEGYIRFPLPTLPDGAVVASGTIGVYNYLTKTGPTEIDVYRITNWWSASQTNWNNKPQRAAAPEVTGNVSTAGWQNFDITNLVNNWYTGRTPNNGVAFVANPDTAEGVGFSSSNYSDTNYYPKLTVNYVIDPAGTNHFWTYTNDGVMPYKGNLYVPTADLGTPGRGVNAGVTRSYNSRQITQEGVFGPGWLSNLDMRVWDMAGSVGFLDASGTVHIFDHNADDTYSPPAGIPLSLTRDDVNSLFKVTTTENTVYYFAMNTGKITKIADSNGNETTFTTEASTGDLLITDPSGRFIRVHFRADGKVDYAIDPKGRKAQYAYDANGMLQSVTLSSGTESVTYSYAYSSISGQNLLTSVTDPKGNSVTYGYDTYKRITSVTRKLNNANITNNYSYNTTVTPRQITVTGMNGEQTVYSTNDNANVVQTDVKLNATDTQTTVYKWDSNNWLYEIDAPNNQITKVQYGNNGMPIKVTTPDGKDVRVNYENINSSNPVSHKDPMHNVQGTNYDSKG